MAINSWKELEKEIEHYDYGSKNILEYGGMPPDTCIGYISNQFLAGIVNYLQNKKIFIMNRYGLSDDRLKHRSSDVRGTLSIVGHLDRYQTAAQYHRVNHHFKTCMFDDTLVYGESDTSLYALWFDCDSSDAFIWRFEKETFEGLTLSKLVELHLDHLHKNYPDWMHDNTYPEAIIVEIDPINGWIT